MFVFWKRSNIVFVCLVSTILPILPEPITSSTQRCLLYSTNESINFINLNHSDSTPPFKSTNQKHGLATSSDLGEMSQFDFILEDGTIFWVDLLEEKIKKVQLPSPFTCKEDASSEHPNITDLFSVSLMPYDGFACDWVSRNLYWVDSEEGRIEVGSVDGRWRGTLVWSGLDQPRDLKLDPFGKYMYWLDVGVEPRIERCGLDGSDRSTLVKKPLVGHPFSLSLDLIGRKMYWLDQELNGVFCADFNGNDINLLPSSINPSSLYTFTMAIGADLIYYVDAKKNFLKSSNKSNLISNQNVWRFSEAPKDMKLIESQIVKGDAMKTPCRSSGCSHMCLSSPQPPFFTCACPSGVVLLPDDKTCNDGPSQMLLLARQTDIRKISLDTPDFTDTLVTNDDQGMIVAVDYDPVEEKVYWTDVDLHVIKRSKVNGDDVEVVLEEGIHTPEGIAIDWLSRLMYWTDTGTDRIEVLDLNGGLRKIIIKDMLDEPRALVVDPHEGYLFWSDWGVVKRIERSLLDGSNRTTVVDWSISWPNGLALDRPMRRLYWADAQFDLIESCNYDGSDRMKIVSGDLPHVFGLALIGDHIYWTEWQRRVLERANKITGQSRSVVIEELPNLMGLAAVNSKISNKSSQYESKGCSFKNGNCSHFCFRLPSESHRCSCPDGFLLSEINSASCDPVPAFIIFNNGSHLKRHVLSDGALGSGDLDLISRTKGRGYEGDEGDDDDDDDEGSHAIGDNFLTDDEEDSDVDDDGDIAGARRSNLGSKEKNKFHLDYIFNDGIVLMYDLVHKRMHEFELESLEYGNINDCYDSNTSTNIQSSNSKPPTTFAVDWLSGNIYWTDWDKIEMSRSDGSSRLVIIWMNCRPRTIVVDPVAGFLFWSNELNLFGTIERTLLDGSFRNIIIRNVGQITGMTIDPETEQLYWADQKLGQIECSLYDGSERKVLLSNAEPYRISLFENSLYWSDVNGQIISTNRLTGSHNVVAKGLTGQVDVKVIHPSLQKGYNFCSMSKDNGGCSNLCINLKKSGSRVTHKCACPTQYVLNKEDNNTCDAPNVAAYVATSNRIISLSLEEISESPDVVLSFHPSNPIRSIEYDPFSDYIYFIEGSTKISYAKSDGSQTMILLDTAQKESLVARMVPFDMVLDHAHNVLYWSDMTYGTIVMTQLTDPISHIVFNLAPGDNLRKPKYLALHSDRQILFWTNGHSIEAGHLSYMTSYDVTISTVINGSKVGPMCVDTSSNVLYWFNMDAHSMEMSRLNGEGRRVIVEGVRSAVGFGVSGSHLYWVDKEKQTFESCLKGNGKQRTIVRGRLPTGLKDLVILNRKKLIKNKSRKKGDDLLSTTSLNLIKCPVDHFSCLLVNHDYPLHHHTDIETNKKSNNGWDKELPGLNSNDVGCIPISWKCDGNVDCLGSHDEINCTSCKEDALLCPKDKKCVGRALICDGKMDCSDGSDENGCLSCFELSDQYSGKPFNCYPGVCYSIGNVCDGVADCENGSDEMDCIQADALERKKGFNYWLTIASVVICAALASIAVLIFLLKQKSTCYRCSQKYQRDGLITLTTTEQTSTNIGTSSSTPAPRLVSSQFSPDKHLLSTSSSTLNVPTENFIGPYPSLATSFADSGLTCTDKSYHDSGGKRNDLQNHDKSPLGERGKTYGGSGWQYCDNDLYFPYDGRSNVDEIPALPPPPPTPCSQSQLLRSRQTSSTGSSNFGDHVAPSNSSMIQSSYQKNRLRTQAHIPPQLDYLMDPRLALPPSGRSSGVSRNHGNSGNSSGCELQRFSTPINGSSKLR